jgi:hypothetical protein
MTTVGGGGGGSLRTAPPGCGGGGGGHTSDLVAGEIQSASLAPVCSARVPVGRPVGRSRSVSSACMPAFLVVM